MRLLLGLCFVVPLHMTAIASANCTPGMLDLHQVSPADGATGVPTNAHVLLRSHGTPQFVSQLPTLALVDPGGRRIALRPVLDLDRQASGLGQRSTVFRPARPLSPNTRYTVTGPLQPAYQTWSFTTGDGADRRAPSSSGVSVGSFDTLPMGCGPAHFAPITVRRAVDDATPVDELWVRVQVSRTAGGAPVAEFIEPLHEQGFDFGHGMCIGNFPLHPGQAWFLDVELLDMALHAGPRSAPMRVDAT